MKMAKTTDFDVELFEQRLTNLKDTQEGIQQMSSWCLQQRSQHKKIVSSWLNVLKQVRVEHRLTLFYLANDVIQYSKRKNYEFVESWGTTLQKATTMVRDEKVRNKIFRIFKIWEQREIYSEEYLSDLNGLLSMNPVKKAPQQTNIELGDEFQNLAIVANIRECVRLEKITDNTFKKLPKAPNCDTETIKTHLKDRSHSDDTEREIDNFVLALENYIKTLKHEIKSRKSLIKNIEQADTFYTNQKGEVKVVVNAYKNFGNRIKVMKRKLEEITPNLPSPIPSPDINAPSPEQDADIILPDDNLTANIFKNNSNGYASYMDGNLPFDINDFKSESPNASYDSGSQGTQPIEVISTRTEEKLTGNFELNHFFKSIMNDAPYSPQNSMPQPVPPVSSYPMSSQAPRNMFNNQSGYGPPPHSQHAPHNPPHGPHNPPHGPHNPQHGPHNPPHGPHNPPHGPHNPQHGPHNPQLGPHNPLHGPHNPPHGPHNPQHGPHNPQLGPRNQPHGPHSTHNSHNDSYNPVYSSDSSFIPSGPNSSYDPGVPLMPPPPMPPSLTGHGEDFNSTWDMDMTWNSIGSNNSFNHVIDTPVSPSHFENDEINAYIEDPNENMMDSMQDVDHRQLHLQTVIPLGNEKGRSVDRDHRNLISLTGSPGLNKSDHTSNTNNTPLWSDEDKDFRQNPDVSFLHTNNNDTIETTPTDIDFRTPALQDISQDSCDLALGTSLKPPPLPPPSLEPNIFPDLKEFLSSPNQTFDTSMPPPNFTKPEFNKPKGKTGQFRGNNPNDNVESIDMEMSDEDLEEYGKEDISQSSEAVDDSELSELDGEDLPDYTMPIQSTYREPLLKTPDFPQNVPHWDNNNLNQQMSNQNMMGHGHDGSGGRNDMMPNVWKSPRPPMSPFRMQGNQPPFPRGGYMPQHRNFSPQMKQNFRGPPIRNNNRGGSIGGLIGSPYFKRGRGMRGMGHRGNFRGNTWQ